MIPFLKWPGGKRWFVQRYAALIPSEFDRYIEPFLGSGSVYFHLEPKNAILGDANHDLIDTYKGIKTEWPSIERLLVYHKRRHSERYYYEIRSSKPEELAEKAARFIYLNRTCFNGIHRVNHKGEFNVPIGTKNNVILPTDDFKAVAKLLAGAQCRSIDFEKIIDGAKKGSFIFADPPYTVRHNLNGFIKYNERLFSWDDQVRLADTLARARERGAKILLTNANHRSVRDLYRERDFTLKTVSRFSSVSADPKSRKQFKELVICAY
jgi:DNA adenine methylase